MTYLRFSPSWVEPGNKGCPKLHTVTAKWLHLRVHQPMLCTLLIVTALQYRVAEDNLGRKLEM